jgi:hypothetical protein
LAQKKKHQMPWPENFWSVKRLSSKRNPETSSHCHWKIRLIVCVKGKVAPVLI